MEDRITHQTGLASSDHPPVGATMTFFTPAEAEAITLTPMSQQRDWRRRGYLPSNDGQHARFDLFSLAEMMSLKLISDRTGPLLARHIAAECGLGIAWNILGNIDAYEGDHHRIGEWEPDAFARMRRRTEQSKKAIREAIARAENERLVPNAYGDPWKPGLVDEIMEAEEAIDKADPGPVFSQSVWLRNRIFQGRGIRISPKKFFVWWANSQHSWCDSLDVEFQRRSGADPRYGGAVLILDLDALGQTLTGRAARPFVHVEIGERDV